MKPTVLNCFGYADEKTLHAPLLSPIDLLDKTTARKLLRVCMNIRDDRLDHFSDYELLCALCKARPLLSGHPLVDRFEYALKNFLDVSTPLSEHNCETVWRECVDRLISSPITLWSVIDKKRENKVHAVFEPHGLSESVPDGIAVVLDASTLYQTAADTWEDWRIEMEAIVSSFSLHGCQHVVFQLPERFRHTEPNPYSVGKALQKKDGSERDLLMAQTFRFLCRSCIGRGWNLILRANVPKKEVLSLLRRTEQTVGLPELIWTSNSYDTTNALLDFSLQDHANAIRCGVCLSEHPSDKELGYMLAYCAARYPIGCITALSGTSLCDAFYEQERFLKI